MNETKQCSMCKEQKGLDQFYSKSVTMRNKAGPKTYVYTQLHCKACNAIYQREYRAKRRIERLTKMAEEHLAPLLKELNAFLHKDK